VSDLWRYFAEFVTYEKAVGGPDPHMAVVVHLARNESFMERAWRGGAYVGAYNVPGAEMIWRAWPWPTIAAVDRQEVVDWCQGQWPIPTRRERRSVRTPEQMGRFLWEYGQWVAAIEKKPWAYAGASGKVRYEAAWDDADQVYTLGRYVKLKLLEYFKRSLDMPLELPDMRPKDGWSPREGLALLYPTYAEALMGDDRAENLALVNQLADIVPGRLEMLGAPMLDRYETQVLLCDFKQAWNGRQFPGRSLDSELEYWTAAGSPEDTELWSARSALFPPEALGEVEGRWDGVRKDLTKVLREHEYTWSDLKFDYLASKDDLAHPVAREWMLDSYVLAR
jgi:hypothetical protein